IMGGRLAGMWPRITLPMVEGIRTSGPVAGFCCAMAGKQAPVAHAHNNVATHRTMIDLLYIRMREQSVCVCAQGCRRLVLKRLPGRSPKQVYCSSRCSPKNSAQAVPRVQYRAMARRSAALKVGIIGGGTIARLFLDHLQRGELGDAKMVAIVGRSGRSRAKLLAKEFRVAFVTDLKGLLARKPEVVVEAAGHEAVRKFAEPLLRKGVGLIVLSAGALCNDALRVKLEKAAERSKALLYVPSGG